ncbi:MAG: MaoC family dehydratase [Acidobacteriota bacterium]|jgi:acyl dehydratase|nr:MaoC family dehydratase [Acidobacteriota bacterium]
MAQKQVSSFAEWKALEGGEFGVSDYMVIDQERIDRFAAATGDFQWIHTDVERAKRESPFGTTIAHGYLTLSLLPPLLAQLVETRNSRMTVNYGVENLRFRQAVPAGARVRLRAEVQEVKDLRGITRVRIGVIMEVENAKAPVFTGTILLLYHFES